MLRCSMSIHDDHYRYHVLQSAIRFCGAYRNSPLLLSKDLLRACSRSGSLIGLRWSRDICDVIGALTTKAIPD